MYNSVLTSVFRVLFGLRLRLDGRNQENPWVSLWKGKYKFHVIITIHDQYRLRALHRPRRYLWRTWRGRKLERPCWRASQQEGGHWTGRHQCDGWERECHRLHCALLRPGGHLHPHEESQGDQSVNRQSWSYSDWWCEIPLTIPAIAWVAAAIEVQLCHL